jgi:hypothetical protein
MGDILIDTQSEPTTPGGNKLVIYADSTSELLTTKNDLGVVMPQFPFIGAFSASDFTGTNVNTAQPIFDTTHDVFTVLGSTTYLINAHFHIHTTGTTGHQLGLLFGGTATLTSIGYAAWATNAATEVTGAPSTLWVSAATVTNVTPSTATATHHTVQLSGMVRINAAGTFIPQYQWSVAPGVAGVTLANSFFMLHPIGPSSRVLVGPVA